jgi:hypothetical protein
VFHIGPGPENSSVDDFGPDFMMLNPYNHPDRLELNRWIDGPYSSPSELTKGFGPIYDKAHAAVVAAGTPDVTIYTETAYSINGGGVLIIPGDTEETAKNEKLAAFDIVYPNQPSSSEVNDFLDAVTGYVKRSAERRKTVQNAVVYAGFLGVASGLMFHSMRTLNMIKRRKKQDS